MPNCGSAVRGRCQLFAVMVVVVQKHTPDVLIMEELGLDDEVQAAACVVARGFGWVTKTVSPYVGRSSWRFL